jgi:elongation factor Tu
MTTDTSSSLAECFLMSVEDVFKIENRGVLVLGRRDRGELLEGQEVEVLGLGESFKLKCIGVERTRWYTVQNEHRGYLLAGKQAETLSRGHAIVSPGSARAHTELQACLTIPSSEENGQSIQLLDGFVAEFFIRCANVTGRLRFPAGLGVLVSGSSATVSIMLDQPVAMEPGINIYMRNDMRRTIGRGIISSVGADV